MATHDFSRLNELAVEFDGLDFHLDVDTVGDYILPFYFEGIVICHHLQEAIATQALLQF